MLWLPIEVVCTPQYFAMHGVECRILPLPTNEANKSFDLVFEIARQLEEFKLNRRALHACCLAVLLPAMLHSTLAVLSRVESCVL